MAERRPAQVADPAVAAPEPPEIQVGAPIRSAPALPAAPHGATTPSVTEQITPALLMMAQTQGSGGKLSVSIAPDQLGQVHITVARAADGTTTIHVAAEQLATLDLLRQDQGSLNQALDQAGVGAGGHSLSFSWDGGAGGGRQSWYAPDDLNGDSPSTAPAGAYPSEPPAARSANAASARGGVDVTA